ncbi:hypothetical protein C8R44DRAFT_730468 [Mycena epipterygia]|nr:hypothetical protein C8R44DRAFT_730468 [Mycena epipterygia]
MIFIDLPEDVVSYFLCLSDISSVISISQTNKYLHHLAFAPALWISLVQDLRNRGFIDRLSTADIRALTTQALVQVVRQLVLGPEAWSPPRPDDSLLGTYHSSLSSANYIYDFAAEVLAGGERVNIVMRIRSWVTPHLGFATVRMYCLPRLETCIIIDFRTQRCCKIISPSHIGSTFWVELIPDYFILSFTPISGTAQEIRVYAIASSSLKVHLSTLEPIFKWQHMKVRSNAALTECGSISHIIPPTSLAVEYFMLYCAASACPSQVHLNLNLPGDSGAASQRHQIHRSPESRILVIPRRGCRGQEAKKSYRQT